MTPARLQRIEEIFYAALGQEPNQINAFLETTCEGDEVVRRKVEVLLASRQRVGSFIETSAASIATKIIENGDAELLVDQTFGHYKISKRIGSGGMGEVYLATDLIAGRKAALKLLPVRFTGDAERLKRFQQEARAVVALNHPNILTVYEIGEDHSTHYIASELIEGETLRQHLTRGRIEVGEAVDIAIQVASALAAAHEMGIVHRDINPGNIMLRRDGYVKVLDFGIAKLAEQEAPAATPKDEALLLVKTNLGSILGTVPYMSPEQTCGTPVDERSDIWSLGVVVYEMVTGHTPFTHDTPREVMTSILEKTPPPLASYINKAPAELQRIISKTLRKERSDRYQSAGEMLQALKNLRHNLEVSSELERSTTPSWLRWARSPLALVLLSLVSALALAIPFSRRRDVTTGLPPQKSIAVLPFENLNKDEENAFFAGGVQDEILTNLAKLADLKVISRTSVMKYKSGLERNLREIAKTLGVSHVVEGSVQRAGGRVRVNAQLIDARNDTHIWAEHYDRDAADIFAIQSEISERIANQLRAKISVAEKAAIAERPTADPVAYAFYAKANDTRAADDWEGVDKSLNRKVELLEKATQHDPNFALAYCELAKTHGDLYNTTWDRQHLDFAKQAAEAAVRVRPDLGVTHLALARYYFRAGFSAAAPGQPAGLNTRNFDRAREQLAVARNNLASNSEALFIEARIDRRQNRWDSALAKLQKANDLDPLNKEVAYYIGETYFQMRQYYQWDQLIKKCGANGTFAGPWIEYMLAELKLAQGDPVAAQSLLDQVPLDFSPLEGIWQARFNTALYLRDYDAADRVIAVTPAKWAAVAFGGEPPDSFADGQIARARGDKQRAQTVFAAARKKLDTIWGDKPKDNQYFKEASILDAGLGRKEDAIREALRAVELMPIAKDSIAGPGGVTNLAQVYSWTGERDRALEQLEVVATIPGGPTYGDLRFNQCWDSLRGDPRFDKIVAAAKAASK